MVIPLWVIIALWGVFIGLTVLLSLINLFHILHYGFWTFKSAIFSLAYYGSVIIILYWAWVQLGNFDWNQQFFSFDLPNFSAPPSL